MVACVAGEEFQVHDILTGDFLALPPTPSPGATSTASHDTSPALPEHVFQTEDGIVRGIWVHRDLLAVHVIGAKGNSLSEQAKSSLGGHLILQSFDK